jgi:hypothetical protein
MTQRIILRSAPSASLSSRTMRMSGEQQAMQVEYMGLGGGGYVSS